MKYSALLFAAFMLFMSACNDGATDETRDSNTTGDEQLQEPVMNSGAETEGERATEAVKDSTVQSNPNAPSDPH